MKIVHQDRSPHRIVNKSDAMEHHTCIRARMPSGSLYRWEFEQDGRVITLVSNSFNANWAPGVHRPSTIRGGVTENILQRVVADLRRQFDISA